MAEAPYAGPEGAPKLRILSSLYVCFSRNLTFETAAALCEAKHSSERARDRRGHGEHITRYGKCSSTAFCLGSQLQRGVSASIRSCISRRGRTRALDRRASENPSLEEVRAVWMTCAILYPASWSCCSTWVCLGGCAVHGAVYRCGKRWKVQ
jgi:hypothetical protein